MTLMSPPEWILFQYLIIGKVKKLQYAASKESFHLVDVSYIALLEWAGSIHLRYKV